MNKQDIAYREYLESKTETVEMNRIDVQLERLHRDQTVYKITCPICWGSGKLNRLFRCWRCKGEGFILGEK